ncbi:hypothetical protein ES704_02059 [subsurface metagenome]|jgi:hypothetical protein
MSESIMAQEMKTWLKQGCAQIGFVMIHTDEWLTELLKFPPELHQPILKGLDNQLQRAVLLGAISNDEALSFYNKAKSISSKMQIPNEKHKAMDELDNLIFEHRLRMLEGIVKCQIGKLERVGEIVMLKVGDRVRILYDEQKGKEGAIVDIPYGTNIYKVHLDGDVSPSTWRPYEVEKV